VLPEAESDTTALMETTAATLRALGHRVDVRTPSFLMDEHWRRNFLTLVGAGTAAEIAYWERELGSVIYPYGLDPSTAQIADLGRKATGSDIAKSYQGLRDYRELAAQWWASEEGADLILTPVLEHPQAPLGWLNDPLEGGRRIRKTMLYTPQFNMSGDPAIALPLGQTPGGLPIGLQLAAARGREDLLFRVGLELEQQMPWSHRTPHLS
jgi:amidase